MKSTFNLQDTSCHSPLGNTLLIRATCWSCSDGQVTSVTLRNITHEQPVSFYSPSFSCIGALAPARHTRRKCKSIDHIRLVKLQFLSVNVRAMSKMRWKIFFAFSFSLSLYNIICLRYILILIVLLKST